MSNLQNRVEIVVTAEASQANKVLNETIKKGDDTWKGISKSQDKWLKVAQDGLERYGGRVGRVLSGITKSWEKVKQAMDATKGIGGAAVGLPPVLGGAGAAGAAGAGAGAASVGGALMAAANPVTIAAAAVGAAAVGVGALALADAEKVDNLVKSVAQYERLRDILRDIKDPAQRLKVITDELGEDGQDKFERLREEAEKFGDSSSGIGRQWAEFTNRFSKNVGGLWEGLKGMGREGIFLFKEETARQINFLSNLNKLFPKSVNDKVPNAPTVDESIEMEKSNLAGAAADKKRKELDAEKAARDKKLPALKKELNDLEIEKLTTEQRIAALNKVLKELQTKADKTGRVEDKLALAKAEKELAELKEKQSKDVDKNLEKNKAENKKKADEALKDILRNNPTLSDVTGVSDAERNKIGGKVMSGSDILQAESDRLRDSALSPSEIALRNAGVSLVDGSIMSPEARAKTLGNQNTKDLLKRSEDIGKLKSFKRVLDPASRYEQNKKNMEKAATLENLAKSFVENGMAWMVKPVNAK